MFLPLYFPNEVIFDVEYFFKEDNFWSFSDLKPKRQPQKIFFFFEKTEIMSTDRSELFSFKNLFSILRDIEKHDKP